MTRKSGFTVIEFLIALSIMTILGAIVLSTFINFRKNQALKLDTQTIESVLRQARSQTLSSKNSSVYGVHFASTKITLFTGATYVAGQSTNQDYPLTSTDTILTISLNGGGSDVVFRRLSGETSQNGTIVVNSSSIGQSKTVTIYKTGLIESN